MTPNELYARPAQQVVVDDFFCLKGCYYDHLPEVGADASELDKVLCGPLKGRFELRFYRKRNSDQRRVWWLYSLWLDGKPVMVLQNAGREGDDHHRRIVTDQTLLAETVRLIRTHLPVSPADEVADPSTEIEGLDAFYSDRLRQD